MKFVQIIDFETERIDEMRQLAEEAERRYAGRRTPDHRYVLKDRNKPNHYLVLIEFDSYEEAMRNSDDRRRASSRSSWRAVRQVAVLTTRLWTPE